MLTTGKIQIPNMNQPNKKLSKARTPEDIDVTKQLVEAGKMLDIELLDHLVIGNPRYVSLKERIRW
jgi:DNA repair protein RadC